MIGVINLDKPVGPTSHAMVGLVRRLSGERRVGHAGTLDPLASGVLPILIGPATRLSEELAGGRKRYDAVVRLGWRSETDDGEGPLQAGSAPPSAEVATEALRSFIGSHPQRPPAYSARKSGGVIAYRAARRGNPLDLAPRMATVHDIQVLDATRGDDHLDLRLDLTTGPGTYVRAIARDLGQRLGCGGYLLALRRTEAAGLRADDARTPDQLDGLAAAGRLAEAVLPVEPLVDLPRLTLAAEPADRFIHGGAVPGSGAGRVLVSGPSGLLGVGTIDAGQLTPRKVLVEVGQ